MPHVYLKSQEEPFEVGRLYLQLFHGRKSVDEDMEDWGTDGPYFGPLTAVHLDYKSHLRLHGDAEEQFLSVRGSPELQAEYAERVLPWSEDCVEFDGVFYGGVTLFVATKEHNAV